MRKRTALSATLAVALVLPLAASAASAASASSGDASFAAGDFPAAEAAYARVLAAHPTDAGANAGAARIDAYRGRFAAAVHRARVALASDPKNALATEVVRTVERDRAADRTSYRVDPRAPETELPFVRTDPLPVVTVTIEGQPARLVIDTGGPGLDLSAAFARRIGLTETSAVRATFAGGRTGRVRTGGRVHDLRLGGVTMHEVPAGIAPVPAPEIDGVLGTAVLARFVATLDYVAGRLVLRPLSASAAFEAAAAAQRAAIVPLYLVPDHFLFARASVDDAPQALFGIDTGGAMMGIDLSAASVAAAHIVPDAAHPLHVMGGGGPVTALPFEAATVSLGSARVHDLPGVSVIPVPGAPPSHFPFTVAGRVSHLFFRHSQLTFDFAAMRLIVTMP